MKCYEIFGHLSANLSQEILTYLQEQEKPAYKAAIQGLASQRKLRAVFIERKPRPERNMWMIQMLSRRSAEDLASQILQVWLLGAEKELICDFLDRLNIRHDGKGIVNDLPASPSEEQLKDAVSFLLEKHRPEAVCVYLQVFQATDETGWPILNELLQSDPRLTLRGNLKATEVS
ncbi:MAG: hypothetical protein JO076_11695 [Verrucomicrobia bacterium]|nr:hypothetical protein [Verrucomicrobiota bacterium]